MWQTSESRRRVLSLDESTSLLGKQTHVGSENRKSYYKVLDRRVFVNVQTNDDDFTTIPQFKKISKNINTHINTKTSKHTNSFWWIWTLSPIRYCKIWRPSPESILSLWPPHVSSDTSRGDSTEKVKIFSPSSEFPMKNKTKTKMISSRRKTVQRLLCSSVNQERRSRLFSLKRGGKRAESWKAEAFPQSRNFINLHLKVTDSTHKTTAGLHTNRTTRAKFWYLQFTLISHGVICTWISIWVTPQNRGWGSYLSYSGSPHSRGSFQTAPVKLHLWSMPKAVLLSTMNMEPVFIGKVSDLSVSMSDVKMESGCEISRYPSPGDRLKRFRDAPALPGAVSLGTLSLEGDARLNS